MKKGVFQRCSFACPACGGETRIRKSETITHLTRSLRYQCLDANADCGLLFEAHVTYVRTISPSAHGEVSQRGRLKRPPPLPLNDPLTRPFVETRAPQT